VENQKRESSATNCRVILKKLWRKEPDGSIEELLLAVPLTFAWAPSERMPDYITVRNDQIVDFGVLEQIDNRFRPILRTTSENFQGYVHAHECLRYGLEIVADNFSSPHLQVFEVAWDGEFSADLPILATHLRVREVTSEHI